MPEKAVYLLIVDGFADWEPAHAVAELRRHGGYRVESVALTPSAVQSMGGLTVVPSKTVGDVDAADVAVFILPGGDRWETAPVEPELGELLKRLDAAGVPIAAICGATVAIAGIGLLRGRRHTSNGLNYLRSHVSGYSEADQYVNAPAVRDAKLITASGLGDVEFARELFEELEVLTPEDRSLWARIFAARRFRKTLPDAACQRRLPTAAGPSGSCHTCSASAVSRLNSAAGWNLQLSCGVDPFGAWFTDEGAREIFGDGDAPRRGPTSNEAREDVWSEALLGRTIDMLPKMKVQLAATHAAVFAARVVDLVHAVAGTTGIRDEHPFQRHFRDVHTITQHGSRPPGTNPSVSC